MPDKPDRKKPNKNKEREFETGMDEVMKFASEMVVANMKKTYDVFLELGVESARRSRDHYDKMMSSAQSFTEQILQNGIEVGKKDALQSTRHGDLAIDNQWNLNEQVLAGRDIYGGKAFRDAVKTIMLDVLSEMQEEAAAAKAEAAKNKKT
jgi:hypothetical protein